MSVLSFNVVMFHNICLVFYYLIWADCTVGRSIRATLRKEKSSVLRIKLKCGDDHCCFKTNCHVCHLSTTSCFLVTLFVLNKVCLFFKAARCCSDVISVRPASLTVKKEKWLQGYCSAPPLEPRQPAAPPGPPLWAAAWRQEVSHEPAQNTRNPPEQAA